MTESTFPALSRRHVLAGSAAALLAAGAGIGVGVGRATPAAAADLVWVNPVKGPITSRFGWRTHPITGNQKFHYGTDVATFESSGPAIGAAAAGTVTLSTSHASFGNYVLVEHSNGVVTAYCHLSSRSVSAGAAVEAGQRVGYMGATGDVTGVHLHLEVRPGGQRSQLAAYDPQTYLAARGVVLGKGSTSPSAPPVPPEVEPEPEEYAVQLIKANGSWYVVDFGQRTYWLVDSSAQLQWLVDGVGMRVAGDDYTTDHLSGYRRIGGA